MNCPTTTTTMTNIELIITNFLLFFFLKLFSLHFVHNCRHHLLCCKQGDRELLCAVSISVCGCRWRCSALCCHCLFHFCRTKVNGVDAYTRHKWTKWTTVVFRLGLVSLCIITFIVLRYSICMTLLWVCVRCSCATPVFLHLFTLKVAEVLFRSLWLIRFNAILAHNNNSSSKQQPFTAQQQQQWWP